MFKNYLLISWRNLWKNKIYSTINIFGLVTGITAFLLIANYLRFEYSYDDTHINKERIFRIPMSMSEHGGKEQTFAFTYPAVAPALKKDFPEIEQTLRLRIQGGIVRYNDQKIIEAGTLMYVDPSIFSIFTYKFLEGNAASALSELNDAVITEETARKYFGEEEAIGKSLKYNNEDYVVKAVIENLPVNAHLQFNILLNYEKYIQLTNGRANTSWGWSDFYTYILVKPAADAKVLESKLPAFATQYLGDDMKQRGYQLAFQLQPLKDIHLKSRYDYELAGNGDMTYLKYLGMAALFILFIAWINYVNLSTAHSLDRSKEVGIRKVVGAGKFQLIRQFLSESLFLNFFALVLGFITFRLTLPAFSKLIEKEITISQFMDWRFWMLISGLLLIGTLLAAFYPAFILSSFQPVYSIKNAKGGGQAVGKNILRKSLVVIQFTAAVVLITAALGFYRQLKFMQSRDLGVDIKQTLVVQQTANQDSADIPSFNAFINDVQSQSGVVSVTASTSVPGGEVGGSSDFNLKNSQSGKRCRTLGIDNKFIPSYGLTVVAGRNLTNDRPPVDTSQLVNILVNETAAKIFGFDQVADILGQDLDGGGVHCRIIGVVKDFHQESLQYGFDPIVFYPEEERNFGNFSIKLNTDQLPILMETVKIKWQNYFPESPFRYFFLDDQFNAQYKNDRLFATVLWLFTVLALIIASLGLFGLSLFTIAKRNKEISIRKVLGATVVQIIRLVTSEYIKLVLLACLIALPLAYWVVNQYIRGYAFHIDLGLWFVLSPVILITVIALFTVIYQTLRAGLANPVKHLRTE